jgi:iron-sulfur cluster repair protein YtfE (RIC family)
MNTHELADRLREEHCAVEALANKVREWVAVIPRSNVQHWIDELKTRYEKFRAHLTKHMVLEERGGYLTTVVDLRPTLSTEIDRLQHEHVELNTIMTSVQAAVASLGPEDRLLVRDCCRRLENLLNYVEHHENDENLLLITTLTTDLGAHD